MTTTNGVDVSNYQGLPDWQAVAAAGYQFALCKATEGLTYVDASFAHNWEDTQVAGLARGAYHFARPDRSTAEAEAAVFLRAVGPLEPGDVLVLDLETGKSNNDDLSGWALTWLQTVEAAVGFRPVLYSNAGFQAAHGCTDNAALAEYGLWLASWGTVQPVAPAAWPFVAIWQHSSTGSVPGIQGDVDLDIFNGTVDQFRAYGLPATPVPVPDVAALQKQIAALTAELATATAALTTARDTLAAVRVALNGG